jgi:tRNA U34 5-methylaminomethyl-2-thiouridine-forming methyltransferase MnmC
MPVAVLTSLMQRQIILTRDGSHSVSVPEMNVTYHSIHGAVQESLHVFIRSGLDHIRNIFPGSPIHILEIGLGTALNALLTLQEAATLQLPIHYTAIDLFPLEQEKALQLNYAEQIGNPGLQEYFISLHTSPWEEEIELTPFFTFHKKKASLLEFSSPPAFHLIYFDAFAPTAQPELWSKEVFEELRKALFPSGALVTYCSKADVRRAMQAAGLTVEKPPGPWGKREMIRAIASLRSQ